LETGKVRVHPNFDFSLLIEEYHLLIDLKYTHFFIEYFETMEASIEKIQFILEWDIIDFLQSQIHLLNVQQSIIDSRTHLLD
jgi:hypothetical protein